MHSEPSSTSTCTAAAPQPQGDAWHGLAEWVKAEAEKIQAALLPVVERWESPLLARGELVEIARANWRRAFGISDTKRPSARQMHRLLQRIIARDGGRREWTRRELYVRENPPRRPGSRAELAGADEPMMELIDGLSGFAVPAAPTDNEREMLWRTAWRWYQSAIEAGARPKAAKAELLRFLMRHATRLAPNRNAMRVKVSAAFKKLAHGKNAGDGRHAKRGVKRAPEIPQADIVKIASYATFATGGRLAQAERELVEMRGASGLSEATRDLMDAGGSKSYVNRRLAEAVQPLIRAAAPYVLGKKAVDDATPSLTRDYSKLRSLQMVTADDFTMPVYFWIKDAHGDPVLDRERRPILTRGQVLLFIDVRSLKIITWTLIPERNYNALAVRTAMNRVCLDEGRPGCWYFERGIWKNSNLVQDRPPLHWRLANPSFADTAGGWEKLGVRFIHATRARSKPAELVGGKLQNFMERVPGYCGRNEREDCPEETKRAKLAVERREHPSKFFYSFDQWEVELGKLIYLYNADKQEGRILDGRSPARAYQDHWVNDEVVKFDPTCWHLCAHYVREFEVKSGGVSFVHGSGKAREEFAYYDQGAFAAYRHRRVLAWFDPGYPGVLGITDLDRLNPFFVQRSNPVDFDATADPDSPAAEHYRAEVAKQAGFNKHARAVFHTVKSEFNRTYRQNVMPRPVAALGKEMLAKRLEAQSTASADDNRQSRIIRKARDLGVPVATLTDFSEDTERSLDRRLKRRKELTSE